MDVFFSLLRVYLYNCTINKKGVFFLDELFKGLIEQSFPVVISIYLLVRLEAKLDTLEKTISALNIQIQKICN